MRLHTSFLLVVQLAVPFHDLGIWTERTFGDLEPSVRWAQACLTVMGLDEHADEVQALITQHHKLRRYDGP